MAHVKTAVSTLGPFYSLNSRTSGRHTSRGSSFTVYSTSHQSFLPKLSPTFLPTHPHSNQCALGFGKCNLFWIVIFHETSQHVLFVMSSQNHSSCSLIDLLYFLLTYSILHKRLIHSFSAYVRIKEQEKFFFFLN